MRARQRGSFSGMPRTRQRMRDIILAGALLFLAAGPVRAACDRPVTPACALQRGAFDSAADYDNCRREMIRHKSGMEAYAACSKGAGQSAEEKAVTDELESTLAQFNRRARGEN